MKKTRRSAISIMGSLIGLIKPLLHIMTVAVVLGTIGYLCAIFITIVGAKSIFLLIEKESVKNYLLLLVGIALLRGVLHYIEQYCNHLIAFKLLAIIRHKVFAVLRKLCPAKLEGKDKGNLISIITTDIELLEVFYAHTISPIMIAFFTSLVMVIFMGRIRIEAGLLALVGYLVVGIVIPLINGKSGGNLGMSFRTKFGELNSFVLDSLRGLKETIQYNKGEERLAEIDSQSVVLGKYQEELSKREGNQRAITNIAILVFSFGMLFLATYFFLKGEISFEGVLILTVSMMGSFGPVVALSSLSNNLNQTLASGERVLSLLEEEPAVEEVVNLESTYQADKFKDATMTKVSFSYDDETILKDLSLEIPKGKIMGIHGASGSGKSTILKLLMRFWDPQKGKIEISGHDIESISTRDLRETQSFVTQETQLFQDSIAGNIAVGKERATREEIIEAAKKASIHDFITSLEQGYDTKVGELGGTLSGGEGQRIGLARAFLHDSPLLLLDEPSSNLDSLNEGIILKSIKEETKDKTVVLVSHRESTMNIADEIFTMKKRRSS
ncbi:MAG TPA: ABC transporter ATP-binding protein/permease [Candidatus Dorea intestinavium]|nr:ABC transporter ATP-binding protein/permease [Candidatus Dorea intestinavium]